MADSVDFEKYLQFIGQDRRYQDVRDHYTETEALILLEAEFLSHWPSLQLGQWGLQLGRRGFKLP